MITQTDTISQYIINHTQRGECQCGRCTDKSKLLTTIYHTADMIFFKVATKDSPTTEEFKRLTQAHKGVFSDVDPFDGQEHGYIELGGWIGDQGMALQYMALGTLLGVFELLTPRTVFAGLSEDLVQTMAARGLVTVKAK